jgi:hypothetical protein
LGSLGVEKESFENFHRGNTTLQAASVRPTRLFGQPFAAPITSADAINGCDFSASMIVNEDE